MRLQPTVSPAVLEVSGRTMAPRGYKNYHYSSMVIELY